MTDTERREIAARLRKCTPPTSYRQAQGGGWSHLCDMALAVGLEREDKPTAWELAQRLADLIEPDESKVRCVAEVKVDGERLEKLAHDAAVELTGIDRDALLALADEMERMPQCELCPAEIVDCSAHPDGCPDALLDHYARRIREALGVADG